MALLAADRLRGGDGQWGGGFGYQEWESRFEGDSRLKAFFQRKDFCLVDVGYCVTDSTAHKHNVWESLAEF